MKTELIVENWRHFLTEDASTKGLALFVRKSKKNIFLVLYDPKETGEFDLELFQDDDEFAISEWVNEGGFIGGLQLEKDVSKNGPCFGAWVVQYSVVLENFQGQGYGKLLYQMGMAVAQAPITSDRSNVSDDALRVWKSFSNNKKFTSKELDNIHSPKTPPKKDDCLIGIESVNFALEPKNLSVLQTKKDAMLKRHLAFVKRMMKQTKLSSKKIDSIFEEAIIRMFDENYGDSY